MRERRAVAAGTVVVALSTASARVAMGCFSRPLILVAWGFFSRDFRAGVREDYVS